MKTIKIIDLYNKIANKEEIPKKIKFENCVYIYNEFDEFYYINGNDDCSTLFDRVSYFDMTSLIEFLNDEVEIIEDTPKEDKKIDKYYDFLDTSSNDMKSLRSRVNELTDTLNEIIDMLNGEENER